jgi:PhzF family phenazine biosynthesis protein
MKLPLFQIDAFAEKAFEGNPAAVVPLEDWLEDGVMQAIAQENNLAETAFFVPTGNGFHIRWFTPNKEVKLCGHATLASAFVLFEFLSHSADEVAFESLSGPLVVRRSGRMLTLDFPRQVPEVCAAPPELVKGLGVEPQVCLRNEDYIAVVASEEALARIVPNPAYLEQLDLRGVVVTAPSSEFDFVARMFAPKYDIPEDPVTGSAYTQLVPFWAERLGRTQFKAKQISSRGGVLSCELQDDRVLISGTAVRYLEGFITL